MAKDILRFRGEHFYLDNFFPCKVEYEGMVFPTVEHAFQGAKTLDMERRRRFCTYATPKSAKAAGRRVKLREDWEKVKIDIMRELVYIKFTINEAHTEEPMDIRKLLLDTGDAHLEEGNQHGDRFWGTVGGVGQNWLGRVLMEVRERIRTEEMR